jgi:galactarate dehydratase
MTGANTIPQVIRVNAADNVVVAAGAEGLKKDDYIASEGVTVLEAVPRAHKVAVRDIPAHQPVIRYGIVVGLAKDTIKKGAWVQEHMLNIPPAPALDDIAKMAVSTFQPLEPLDGYTFQGYRNSDGMVGIRNILAISTTVFCVDGVLDVAIERIRKELMPKYSHVDDVVAIKHDFGCGIPMNSPDIDIPVKNLRNLILNPNFGEEVLLVALGCEKNQPDLVFPQNSSFEFQKKGPYVVMLQDAKFTSFDSMVQAIVDEAEIRLRRLDARRRVTCPASDLVIGMQCGGSDAFSGMTCNPALGFASDLVIRAGGTTMYSEMSEVRDRVDLMAAKAASKEVIRDLVDVMKWNDDYLAKSKVERTANSTPGNKAGGLNNIAEKSMGTVIKSGSAPMVGVIKPGERMAVDKKGLYFCATPAIDHYLTSLQMAAGCTMHVFTTGRGTPYGLREMPVVKVSSRTELYNGWNDFIDVDAGPIVTGEKSIEDVGWELFKCYLDVASGQKTKSEMRGIYNRMVLFNPNSAI